MTMGRKGKKRQRDHQPDEMDMSTKKRKLKPYRKKHVNHRSRQFWKEYNDDLNVLSNLDEEE